MNTPATTKFFEELASRASSPIVTSAAGSVRWEVVDGDEHEHWFVNLNHGNISVSQTNDTADVTSTMDRGTSEATLSGKSNAMAGYLRGVIDIRGDMGLAMAFQRLFPGPPSSKGPMS